MGRRQHVYRVDVPPTAGPVPGRPQRHYLTRRAAEHRVRVLADRGITATVTRSKPVEWR